MASLFDQSKDIVTRLGVSISGHDFDSFLAPERQLLSAIKRLAIDAKLDVRDYEYAETRTEQIVLGKTGVKRLEELRKTLVAASEYNLFSAIDVAQLSAQIEQLISRIE